MSIFSYGQLKQKINDLATERAIILPKTENNLFAIRIQSTGVKTNENLQLRATQLFVRVSVETGDRAGIPLRAYIRV